MYSVLSEIWSAKAAGKPLMALLIDPEKTNPNTLALSPQNKPDFFFVGGSTGGDTTDFVRSLRTKMQEEACETPIVLFPGNIEQFTGEADALLYLSLLSGRNPEMLVGSRSQRHRKCGSRG